ncbi:MAG: hypothetical protein HYX55_03740 [Chloroflexi bacterium]|nr:hypothetical protein [Chloroflexota bacterium]
MRQALSDTTTTADIDPAEGRPDMDLPGADYPKPASDPEADLPERLGRRIADGPGEGMVAGETDLLPDVEVPDGQM